MGLKNVLPVILTVTSCVATIGAVVLSAYETPNAIKTIDDHRLEIDPSGESDLSFKEKAIDYIKSYKYTEIATVVAIGSNIAGCVLLGKNYKSLIKGSAGIAALSTAYTSKYRNRVRQMIGEEKEKIIDAQARRDVKNEISHYTDAVWFYLPFPNNPVTGEPVEGISFKSSLSCIKDQYINVLHQISKYEVVSLDDAFPQLSRAIDKNDPRQHMLDRMWHQDTLLDGYDIFLPEISFDKINFHDGSEDNTGFDPNINNGEPTYIIHLYEEPEAPETIMLMDC